MPGPQQNQYQSRPKAVTLLAAVQSHEKHEDHSWTRTALAALEINNAVTSIMIVDAPPSAIQTPQIAGGVDEITRDTLVSPTVKLKRSSVIDEHSVHPKRVQRSRPKTSCQILR